MSEEITRESFLSDAKKENINKISLLLKSESDSTRIQCIFEGEEDKFFYLIFIKNIFLQYEVKNYNIGGYKSSFVLYEKMQNQNPRTLFFIDSDLRKYYKPQFPDINSQQIYYTDYYSFENYFVNPQTFMKYASIHLGIRFKLLREHVELFKKEFEKFIPVGIIIAAVQLTGHQKKMNVIADRIKINEFVSIKDSCEVQITEITKVYEKLLEMLMFNSIDTDFLKLYNENKNKIEIEINKGKSQFNEKLNILHKYFRGHYIFNLFKVFINKYKNYMNQKGFKPILSKEHSSKELIEFLSFLIFPPKSLIDFLNNNLMRIENANQS
jgi:hypothetical protein